MANTTDMGGNWERLMVRYQAGDFAAAQALIAEVSPQLLRFFVARRASRADADDLLQETWLRIHQVRHTYRQGEPVSAWFYAIARHVQIDHYRRTTRAAIREQHVEDVSEVTTDPAVEHGSSDDLETLLKPLSASQREIIEMLKVAGMSLEEVARIQSSTVGAVKQKVHRAYATLRKAMRGRLGPQQLNRAIDKGASEEVP
jgi:RNA polymerase sigma-70 factor (ECF subfamily)